jgi:hypothetical protein
MRSSRVMLGDTSWLIPDGNLENVIAQIKEAMENSTVVSLDLIDTHGRPIIVLLNGRTVQNVAIDLDLDPRPSEIM